MEIASLRQNFQDWITQQWVILFGKKIIRKDYEWLVGPFGNTKGIGQKFIQQLAVREQLEIELNQINKGLIQSIDQLGLTSKELERLSKNVIDFYENTSNYDFDLTVKWNPFFKAFGFLLKVLFSNRIEQLNLPMKNNTDAKNLKSDIIHLVDKKSKELKRTVWLRTFAKSNEVIYSGVYETCIIPNGKSCIKAMFPLPNGNATVILEPSVGSNGELVLQSLGKRIGESGFYFLLEDTNGSLWTKYIKSFKDKLVVHDENDKIKAVQTMTLWGFRVLTFIYHIELKSC